MATKSAHKRLTREYLSLQKSPPDYITAHPSETNILEWHYILTGPPQTPYHNGQYWGTLTFPPDYPFAPPAIRMHTPSGRFRCSERLCLSISDFHPKSFNPAWEVSTILLGVLSFMTSEEMTTGSISGTEAVRRELAGRSRWWNSTGGGTRAREEEGKGSALRGGGFGAVKVGDGGRKFREQFPELDEENWRWMGENLVDPQTGRRVVPGGGSGGGEAEQQQGTGIGAAVVEGGQAARQAGEAGHGWLRRNWGKVIVAAFFVYVIAARVMGEQTQQRSS
ncbi:UBC-like protein [Teratosphaeria nubilosa]|uniref:UBC-like protein n=1 Tax=Teratosphaeria nubilosa TaxID=161662 RepID=A0A6G1KW91_9PEZI|nr:UBC-like protein [Teratosphaeria nubilosa]